MTGLGRLRSGRPDDRARHVAQPRSHRRAASAQPSGTGVIGPVSRTGVVGPAPPIHVIADPTDQTLSDSTEENR
ncbi:hypothetical protein [Pseudonocardia endophytica]|uniref:Uncharacterized protein n=1 Tax=Pseudonocardia endophytica TaxID=401976 RepID=A0A4R1HP42_PSEEN|nr:hypothetical protein [Pseudonocardia endophytica]TCK22903.1 hypothetical protein EV378_6914 [Pseudonocardia endophytica]